MKPVNILEIASRGELRRWYEENHAAAREFWLPVNRGKERLEGIVDYLDAVEEAMCFGWIDSTVKYLDGRALQRFTPRRKGGFWTQLNRERVRRLESLGLMSDAGRDAMPPDTFKMDKRVKAAFKKIQRHGSFSNQLILSISEFASTASSVMKNCLKAASSI